MASTVRVAQNQRRVKEYRLAVRGVFGRNRKAKFATFPLAEIPQEAPDLTHAQLRALANECIVREKVKPGARWYVSVDNVTIESTTYADNVEITSRLFAPFDTVKLIEGAL